MDSPSNDGEVKKSLVGGGAISCLGLGLGALKLDPSGSKGGGADSILGVQGGGDKKGVVDASSSRAALGLPTSKVGDVNGRVQVAGLNHMVHPLEGENAGRIGAIGDGGVSPLGAELLAVQPPMAAQLFPHQLLRNSNSNGDIPVDGKGAIFGSKLLPMNDADFEGNFPSLQAGNYRKNFMALEDSNLSQLSQLLSSAPVTLAQQGNSLVLQAINYGNYLKDQLVVGDSNTSKISKPAPPTRLNQAQCLGVGFDNVGPVHSHGTTSVNVAGNPKVQPSFINALCGPQLVEHPNTSHPLHYEPPLREEGRVKVLPPPNIVEEGCEVWKATLIGYFVGNKLLFPVVNSIAHKIWGSSGLKEVLASESGFFFFKFDSVEHACNILEKAPWHMANRPLVLKRWQPNLKLAKEDMRKIPVWIRLYNLPLEYWTVQGLCFVASAVGIPLHADHITLARKRLSFAHRFVWRLMLPRTSLRNLICNALMGSKYVLLLTLSGCLLNVDFVECLAIRMALALRWPRRK